MTKYCDKTIETKQGGGAPRNRLVIPLSLRFDAQMRTTFLKRDFY